MKHDGGQPNSNDLRATIHLAAKDESLKNIRADLACFAAETLLSTGTELHMLICCAGGHALREAIASNAAHRIPCLMQQRPGDRAWRPEQLYLICRAGVLSRAKHRATATG
jgi:hypothetical protein